MITKTIALSGAILLGAVYAASAGALPSIDIPKTCRASEATPLADNTATFDVCMSDEQAARETLVEDWANVPAGDKARCVLPMEYLPSYVEWLTCLEMEREFRKIRPPRHDEQHEVSNHASQHGNSADTPNGPFFYIDTYGVPAALRHQVRQPHRPWHN